MDDKDIRLSATEVFEFENAALPSPADRGIIPEATLNDLNDEVVERIIMIHQGSKALRGTITRTDQMARLNMTDNSGRVRLAGLLAAGQYPQQYYPKLLIDVSVHPDVEKSDPDGPRFLDRVLCDGNMPEAIDQAVETVAKNLRTPTFVVGAGAGTDTGIPKEVLREVIANAVIHREYDSRFTGEAVAVDVYPDRVEVSNPGGLWGGATLENIANGISRCRNTTLVQLMHKIPYSREDAVTVEGGGTGIPLIIREMASRALGEPKFEASPDRFTVTLARYGVEYQQNHQWLEHLANRTGSARADHPADAPTSGNDECGTTPHVIAYRFRRYPQDTDDPNRQRAGAKQRQRCIHTDERQYDLGRGRAAHTYSQRHSDRGGTPIAEDAISLGSHERQKNQRDDRQEPAVSTQTPASPCRCRHGDCHRTSVQQKPSIQARIITIAAITVSAEGFATKWLK